MRLITLQTDSGPRAAVQRDGRALLIPAADGGAQFQDVGALLQAGSSGLQAARSALEGGGEELPVRDSMLLRPVLNPGATVCVGLNYRTHIEEMGIEVPTHPTLFSKIARSLTDPFADVVVPPLSNKVDYEGELAVVIGTAGSDIPAEQAWDHVAGLTVINDVSMRDYQNRTRQWFAGKNFGSSTPVGPAVVTIDEIDDVAALELTVTVNGEERQRALLSDLVFDIPSLIADLSQFTELQPGDIIATGTPGGVGAATETFLNDGDVVEVTVDGLGTIRNTFRLRAA
jgi:acylpyruvate hydrolase